MKDIEIDITKEELDVMTDFVEEHSMEDVLNMLPCSLCIENNGSLNDDSDDWIDIEDNTFYNVNLSRCDPKYNTWEVSIDRDSNFNEEDYPRHIDIMKFFDGFYTPKYAIACFLAWWYKHSLKFESFDYISVEPISRKPEDIEKYIKPFKPVYEDEDEED